MDPFLISLPPKEKPLLNFYRSVEFGEEAKVVLEIVAKVVDLPFEHCYTFQTHSEGETAILLAVDSGCLEDVGIDHSAAHDLKPAGTLANVATLAVADVAADVDLA